MTAHHDIDPAIDWSSWSLAADRSILVATFTSIYPTRNYDNSKVKRWRRRWVPTNAIQRWISHVIRSSSSSSPASLLPNGFTIIKADGRYEILGDNLDHVDLKWVRNVNASSFLLCVLVTCRIFFFLQPALLLLILFLRLLLLFLGCLRLLAFTLSMVQGTSREASCSGSKVTRRICTVWISRGIISTAGERKGFRVSLSIIFSFAEVIGGDERFARAWTFPRFSFLLFCAVLSCYFLLLLLCVGTFFIVVWRSETLSSWLLENKHENPFLKVQRFQRASTKKPQLPRYCWRLSFSWQ